MQAARAPIAGRMPLVALAAPQRMAPLTSQAVAETDLPTTRRTAVEEAWEARLPAAVERVAARPIRVAPL